MDAMHEKGVKAFPAKTEGKGNQLLDAADGEGREGLRPHRRGDPVGGRAGQEGEGVGVQRPGARPADPRPRGRPGARRSSPTSCPSPPSIHFHGLELPNDQDGVPFITQPPVKPGETLHLRVHRAERRLAHVPLAPQRREAGRARAARRVHRRAEAAARRIEQADVDYVMILNDGVARLHAQRQGLPGHRADRGQAGPEGPHPLHERRDDDPPDAPARDAHDRHRQGRLGSAGALEVRHAQHRARASAGT